jgi:hypothetical protein
MAKQTERFLRAVLVCSFLVFLASVGASKLTDSGKFVGNTFGTSYDGDISEYEGFATISLPVRGAVDASIFEDCSFRKKGYDEVTVFGYNDRRGGLYKRDKPLVYGTRANIVPVFGDCDFTIEQQDVQPIENIDQQYRPRGAPQNGWMLFSPVETRDVANLENAIASDGDCDLKVVEGNPTYKFTLKQNIGLTEDNQMQPDSTYWIGTEGSDCGPIKFGDIPPVSTPPETQETENDQGDDTEDDSSANGGDTESGGEGDSATGTGKLQFELVDTEDRQISGGSINVEGVSHSYPKEFGDPYEVIYGVPKGQEHDVSIECGDAQLDADIKLGSDTKKIELLLAEPSPGTMCSQYGGGFSERSRAGIFDVREGDPRPELVTLGTAEYRFSVDNGNQRIPFEKVPDEVGEFEQDRAYKLLFSVRAYRPGTSSTVDVFDEDVEMSVQGPDVATNGDCSDGVDYRCNTPASAQSFESGNYRVQLFDTQKQQTIKRKQVELPEISYSGYY